MASDTPSSPPPSTDAARAQAPPASKLDVEYDDFGLPVRQRRPRTPVPQDDSDDDGAFEDTVASQPAAPDAASLPDKGDEGAGTVKEDVEEKAQMKEMPKRIPEELPQLNGGVAEPKSESGKLVDDKPVAVQSTDDKPVVKDLANEKSVEEKPAEEKPVEEKPVDDKPLNDKPADDKQQTLPLPKSSSPAQVQHSQQPAISEYSHQHAVSQPVQATEEKDNDDGGWQTMPAYARYDMYDDDNRLIAKENTEELEDMHGYGNVGGAAKGYTRVIMDDDADSQTSMDDNTAYLFKEKTTALYDDDEAVRDPLMQMEATKNLLTEGQRIAYVGLVRLAMIDMERKFSAIERKNKSIKKALDMQIDTTKMWAQKTMVRLYGHMEITVTEQVMIEQLSDHGVIPADLTPALMKNARVKNPVAEEVDDAEDSEAKKDQDSARPSVSSPRLDKETEKPKSSSSLDLGTPSASPPPPPYEEHPEDDKYPEPKTPSQLPETKNLDIDLRWTVLCDLFLVLIADSIYDSRSRELFQLVGKYLSVDWLEICRFEKRVTDALEMQEEANKENWNEEEHMETRRKRALHKRIAFMGLATVGGGLVIGLSAGLLAPVIGVGLAGGFSAIGIAGTGSFLAGAGGTAIITTTAAISGSTIGVRAANRRTGAVKTFEYRPLHNNKRTHLIITLAGWMSGKADDVRLPYSTVDPIMGDIYSVLWEPEMLRSMGDTINILATEALTQGLQQVLGSTLLIALMSAMQLPLALTKLSYLIDNPWTVSQARADMAGLILADSIIDRNLGTRPVTLVGFSLGARVIYACLRELANRGAYGLVQNVYMFGTPIVAKNDEYTKFRAVVPGRFVNGYATNDWILGYLFRATGGGVARVAGLAPIQIPTIENINVTEWVPGHMAYRAAMPRLLREAGWLVESDEFTEIEDPDPENHEQRQRELIDDIEEARRELEKKNAEKEKRGSKLSWWRKKKGDKKEWEVYDELSQQHKPIDKNADPARIAENPVMFDIDAIRKEVAALAAEGNGKDPVPEFEIKEIKSTLPPMKIDMSAAQPGPYGSLRETKSYNDSLGVPSVTKASSTSNLPATNDTHNGQTKGGWDEYDEFDDPGSAHMTMTFDSSFREPAPSAPLSKSGYGTPEKSAWDAQPSWNDASERPPLRSATTMPLSSGLPTGMNGAAANPGYNAWADDDDDEFGKEKEVKMSFM